MEWKADASELLGSPRHDLVDEPFGRRLVVGEPFVVGCAESVTVAHFTGNVELSHRDHPSFLQGIPDRSKPTSWHEPGQIIVLQINEAVAPSEVDPANIDPMKQEPCVIGKMLQLFGQMDLGIEGVWDVEDDFRAGSLGFPA